MRNGEIVIGILGGMGPYATLDMYKNILDSIHVMKEWEYPQVVISSNPKIPSRTRAYLFKEKSPVPGLIKEAQRLEDAGATFIIVACNSAHYYLNDIKKHVKIPILNMVELTSKYIKANTNYKKIGIVGGEVTINSKIYDEYLNKYGIETIYPNEEEVKILRSIIDEIKHNRANNDTYIKMHHALFSMNEKGAEAIILACTEFPTFFKGMYVLSEKTIDPNKILIDSALIKAGYVIKDGN